MKNIPLNLACLATALLLLAAAPQLMAQKMPPSAIRLWSVGPLATSQPSTGLTLGAGGATLTAAQSDSQTGSVFAATRRVVFAGDRVVIAIPTPGAAGSYSLLSLDARTGEVKDKRELAGFGLRAIFATSDAHVIVSGSRVLRLTPDLKDDGAFNLPSTGHQHGRVENISPDGSTLGDATSPGFELVNAQTLQPTQITTAPSVDTSINNSGFVTDNIHWAADDPKDVSFVTYTDAKGSYQIYHGKCGGRPQFLSDQILLVPGCKKAILIDSQGTPVRTLQVKGDFAYAGASQNGKRFALQIATFSASHQLQHERFAVYSLASGELLAEVTPDALAEEQSWTAFSADGSMFVVGSPQKLTLYRLP